MAPIVGYALLAATTAVSAVSSIQQGRAAKKNAAYNAALQRNEGIYKRQKAESDERKFRRQSKIDLGRQRAKLFGAGVDPGSVTALNLLAESAAVQELDALTIRYGGEIAETSLLNAAKLTESKGKQAQTAGYFSAGATILSGAGRAIGSFKTPGPSGVDNPDDGAFFSGNL